MVAVSGCKLPASCLLKWTSEQHGATQPKRVLLFFPAFLLPAVLFSVLRTVLDIMHKTDRMYSTDVIGSPDTSSLPTQSEAIPCLFCNTAIPHDTTVLLY